MMDFLPLKSWLFSEHSPVIISGPCGAESYQQLTETARQLKALNRVSLMRAGVWKPRTRPNSFEGKGEEALKWLRDVRDEFGFKVTVEVANAQHTEMALNYGIDVLWIGARTTVSPFSVQEVADVLKGVDIPVMVKNPVHADLQLWIGAIERIYSSGIKKIAAVHRGFYFAGKTKYRNKPYWQIPIDLRTQFPNLPVICDPSHISGNRELLLPVSQRAMDLGFDGLMIESHHKPDTALSDSKQQITPSALGDLLDMLVLRKPESEDKVFLDKLQQLRSRIDEIDEELIRVLKKRGQVIEKIGAYKKEHGITIFQLARWQEILRTRAQWAEEAGLSRTHVEKLCQLLHEESIRLQNLVMNK